MTGVEVGNTRGNSTPSRGQASMSLVKSGANIGSLKLSVPQFPYW